MKHTQVVVVGADPVGLVTALGLAKAGLDVLVVDTGREASACAPCVHDWSVLPGLDRLGVLEDATQAGFTDPSWCLRVLQTGEHLTFDLGVLAGLTPHPYNLHVEDTALCEVLERHLARHRTKPIERNARLVDLAQDQSGVEIVLETGDGVRRLRTDWVVAADGTSSMVRRLLGLGFRGSTWHDRSVVALVDADFAGRDYAGTTLQVDDRYGAVVHKVDDRRWRYTFDESLTLPEESVGARIPGVLRKVLGSVPFHVLDWHSSRMHQRTSDQYRAGRVLLVGDSAHVANRMIGHSPITAFFDAYRLIEALSAVAGGYADERVLDKYSEGRKRVFLDHALPASAGRKHLISQISDRRQLETELEHYRLASADPEALRELLLFNRELEGDSPLPRGTSSVSVFS
ncbi:NAD(P)/FAD-dependent oxidoreductase [Haloechinothrix salitolerans]|uniref:NAD(P)/FAD-dependent oxidoreductase n=1 Tax=Haloechinothrix salitolerans TaxID=926830 RepID=A0ABW2BWY6_9PSEU